MHYLLATCAFQGVHLPLLEVDGFLSATDDLWKFREVGAPGDEVPLDKVDAILGSALEVLRIVSILIVPAMPSTAGEVWRRIGLDGSPGDQRLPAAGGWGGYPGGRTVEKGAPLFPRRKS